MSDAGGVAGVGVAGSSPNGFAVSGAGIAGFGVGDVASGVGGLLNGEPGVVGASLGDGIGLGLPPVSPESLV